LTVIGNEFSPIEGGRLPETPATDVPASADEMARHIESIELSDAADSLVSSYTCKCGAEIRQYASRIVGECTCQQNRRAPPGKGTWRRRHTGARSGWNMSTNHQRAKPSSSAKRTGVPPRSFSRIQRQYGGDGSLMVEWAKLVPGILSEREKPAPEFTLVA
jgi:hypothetical protein